MNHPTSRPSRGALVALVLSFAPAAMLAGQTTGCSKPAAEAQAQVYTAKGVIKSFGPDRKFANIAHEKIPNYMDAMTMSFEPTTAGQLEGLAAGDKVTFSFKAQDGKHLLTAISKDK
jgi:Cu(I)/Ag(I) efflux system protein CusF